MLTDLLRILKFLACCPPTQQVEDSESLDEVKHRRPTLIESSWKIVKMELGPDGKPGKSEVVIESIQETFSMGTQTFFLICAISEGFVLTDLKVL